MAPLKKLAKLVANSSTLKIQETVHQALISEKKAREGLFSQLTGKGRTGEVAAAIWKICTEQEKVTLYLDDLKCIREYYVLLGAETAVTLFGQYEKAILEHCDAHSRNLVLILCYFLSTVNIVSFEKLRSAVKDSLPHLIGKLWEAGKAGESCYVALHLMYILLAEQSYIGGEDAQEIWSAVITKSMRKSPNMACLSCLLNGESNDWVGQALSSSNLDDIASSKDTEMCLRKQLCRVFLAHKASLFSILDDGLCRQLTKFAIKEYAGRNEVSSVLSSFVDCAELSFKHEAVWRIVISAMLQLIQEELETIRESKELAHWIGSLANLFCSESEDTSKPVARLSKKFIEHSQIAGSKFKNFTCGYVTKGIATALNGLPLKQLSESTQGLCKPTLLVLCSVFHSSEKKVFEQCIQLLADLLKMNAGLSLSGQESAWIDNLCSWLPAVEEMSNAPILRPSMVTVLSSAFEALPAGFDKQMQYLASDVNDNDPMSEGRLIRLAAEFSSSPWKMMRSLSKTEKELLLQEIKSNALDRIVKCIDFGNSKESGEMAEKWSFVFTLFEGMNREDRTEFIPLLLAEKQRKKLCKAAVNVLNGSYEVPLNIRQIVVRRAANFYSDTVPSFELGDVGGVSNVLNWSCLCRMRVVDQTLVQRVFERVSPEKIADLFTTVVPLLEGDDIDLSTILLVAADGMTPKINSQAEKLLLPVASLLEAGSENTAVLGLAANCVLVFAETVCEKQIVNLSFTVAASLHVVPTDVAAMFSMDSLLYNALRYTHPSVNNDQCALFGQLLVKHFRAVQRFVQYENGSITETDRLVYGCARIANQLVQHSKYYGRLIACLISDTLMGYQYIELAMCKLHVLNDKYSAAFLATSLPPTEKRQYSRVFPDIKKSLKRVV